ncbi:hypothetical protein J4416_05080 [Candidatus Pacearchaeota archaeon]|nr:hypothetical protein [Candidatus Pacearchaeota archaeon]
MKKKGAFELDQIGNWIIALVVIILVVGLYIILKDKGNVALEFFKNLWRFGR